MPWIQDKQASTFRFQRKRNRIQIRIYRHDYTQPNNPPIIYTSLEVLAQQILRGAFCFVPDSHFEINGLPTSPYCATIDLDPQTLEYDRVVERTLDLATFIIEFVGIVPICVYSGNKSFHLKLYCGDFGNRMGYLLPRTVSYETYRRRRKTEMSLTMLRDAVDILLMAYNDWTRLGPGAILVGKYAHKSLYPVFFDNRTGAHTGARVPGSFHEKSGRFARVMDLEHIPPTITEMKVKSGGEYLLAHPEYLTMPDFSPESLTRNTTRLLNFTNTWYAAHFRDLVYKRRVFN